MTKPSADETPTLRTLDDPAAAAILASVGACPYEWSIPNDQLRWGDSIRTVLPDVNAAALSSGRGFAQLLAPASPAGRYDAIVNSPVRDIGDGVPYTIEYCLSPRPGVTVWVEDAGRWFASPDGRPIRASGVIRVVNDRRAREQRLSEASEIDPTTGQMARQRFTEVVRDAVAEAITLRGSIGLLIASIDGLSRLNEAYGFEVADEVIATVGKRLRSRMRGGDILGRMSGGKFGVLVRNCQAEDLSFAAERLLAAVADGVIETSVGPVSASITIGGAAAPRHARTEEQLFARAQEVLDQIKSRRVRAFEIYSPSPERDRRRRENIQMADAIVAALNDRRISLAFQPIVSAGEARRVSSYECLLRLRAADGAMIPAASVVPTAERLGLVRMIDHRVLELAVAELQAAPEVDLSINVSPASTLDRGWIELFEGLLRREPALAGRLMIEITETAAIADIDEARRFVARVQEIGARVAIDDFGAGYTSFRNLRRLGVDCVKIDGAYVENFERSDDDRRFVETLLGLARHMNLRTVAEWVPTETVAQELARLGCDFLQGVHTGAASESRPWLRDVAAA